jgi:CHAT domain-containing protein
MNAGKWLGRSANARRCLGFSLLSAGLAWIAPCAADESGQWIGEAASGRHDQLEKTMEGIAARRALDTAERHALCFAYAKLKRYTPLFTCLDTLAARIKQGDTETLLFGLEDATPLVNIMRAEALIELGQYAQAQKEAAQAVTWLEKNGAGVQDMLFNALAAQTLAHALAGERSKAETIVRHLAEQPAGDYASAKAFALARARMGLKDYQGVLDAFRSDSGFALRIFLDRLVSASFFTGVNNWAWVELPRAFMLNKALLETGRKEEARAGFEQLLAIPQVRENGDIYWLLEDELGQIAEAEQRFDAALAHYRAAIDTIERQRASINTEASKIGFIGDKEGIYARIVDLARRMSNPELAFEFIERAKSRALVDLLASREGGAVRFAAPTATARTALEAFYTAQDAAGVQKPIDMRRSAQNPADGDFSSAPSVSLRQQAPALASLVAVETVRPGELRQFIGPNEALLEYFASGNAFYGMAISQTGHLLLRLENDHLEEDVRAFRQEIEAISPYPSSLAQRLHRQLIAPFAAILGARELLIVPHGPLHYLPFAALHDGQTSLVARHDLRFLPSVSTQKYLRAPRPSAVSGLLLFGNPDLGRRDYDLPSAEEEARAIAVLVGSEHVLTRREATETAFRSQARAFPYLHIASHGEFNAGEALDSRLLLAADPQNDGMLTVRELYEITLDAELVTLSACETGLSRRLSGDDLVGLARGFMYAGSSNIVASLWQVDDEATARLMRAFYRHLGAGAAKKSALRKAQLSLLDEYPEPIFWAAFYLTGNGQ